MNGSKPGKPTAPDKSTNNQKEQTMGRPSKEQLEELIHASWRDLTLAERRIAIREMDRRANNDSAVKIFAEDLLRAHPGLSALEAWDKAKGLHETEQHAPAPVIYGKDTAEPTPEPSADGDSDVWLDELPADEHHSRDTEAMGIAIECRQHPGKWRRLGCFATRKQAQTRAEAIRRNKKTWAGVGARAIDRDQRHETWISYQGGAQ